MRRSAVSARPLRAPSGRRWSNCSPIVRHLDGGATPMSTTPVGPPRRIIELTIDGDPVKVAEGETLLAACDAAGIDTPTLCYGPTITPANACRVCVVELEGSRALVPACSRRGGPGVGVPPQL